MSKKQTSPFLDIAQEVGKDVGEIKRLLEQNNSVLTAIQQTVENSKNEPSSPPATEPTQTEPNTAGNGYQHYSVEYHSLDGSMNWEYKIPLPQGFEGKKGLLLVKTKESGKWVVMIEGTLHQEAMVESAYPCEVIAVLFTEPKATLESPDGWLT